MKESLAILQFVFSNIIMPIQLIVGITANGIVMLIWHFGTKSRQLPFSVYFSTLALVDFVLLAFPGTLRMQFIFTDDVLSRIPNVCRFLSYVDYAMIQNSNWISAILTLERALTILCPIRFQTRWIKRRSKRVLIVLTAFTTLNNIPHLIFAKFDDTMVCHWDGQYFNALFMYELIMDTILCVTIPIVLSVACNFFSFVALSTSRNHQIRNDNRTGVVITFKRLTFWTGVTLLISNFLWTVVISINLGVFTLQEEDYVNLFAIASVILYFNSSINPLFSFYLCNAVRTDFKDTFRRLLSVIHRRSRTVGRVNDQDATGNETAITTII